MPYLLSMLVVLWPVNLIALCSMTFGSKQVSHRRPPKVVDQPAGAPRPAARRAPRVAELPYLPAAVPPEDQRDDPALLALKGQGPLVLIH